ncbi:SdrD B-like domain-containing protein [Bradyrhizobium sp. AUGA SZCCT0283]|uniref:DUF7507 domain-containing protein n=1 Tax=Bradyrhizobium sp. AUGA SZCCT0283 TaxID=2807671 RepID=UPI001BA6F44E|nr:SdrD B-like domain-containing protein [Bradyrhizobium sp. AUGA SZCCT0283]MBR1279238.1 hypothetical protein [Bradyrhizobium sp. AUGA SZCCT0283]
MATIIDLKAAGSSTTIDGAIFQDSANVGSGTGNYNTFLAISPTPSQSGNEQGFNSDDTTPIDPSNQDIGASKTHTVLLSTVPITIVNGVQYYEFRVDLNEANSNPDGQISLDQFKIYSSTSGTIESTTTLFTQNLVYSMDGGPAGDISLQLSEVSTGSGTDDYAVLVPVSKFAGLEPATTYMYLYVDMGSLGGDYVAASGFEEWNLQSAGTLRGTKFNDIDSDGIKDAGEGGVAGVTIFIDANKNGVLDAGERSTVTDANGNYTFNGVPLGTWQLDEVTPAGQTQTTGAFETATITTVGQVVTVDPIGNHLPQPDLTIVKDADKSSVNAAGQVINYTITVDNSGNVDLTNPVVTDAFADAGSLTFVSGDDGDGVLETNETWHYTATHTVTQAEMNAGANLVNVASVDTDQTAPEQDDATTTVAQNPDLTIVKDAVVADGHADHAGDVIHYTVAVENTGNVDLTNVVVKDTFEGGAAVVLDTNHLTLTTADDAVLTGDDGDGILEVNETWIYKYDHIITQSELDTQGVNGDGSLDNIASVTTTQTGPDSDDAHILVELGPGVRTPGFWAQSTGQSQWTKFWDGIVGNEPKQAGTNGFANGEITYNVDSNLDGVANGADQKGLLIGDYNKNGIEDGGENVLFISTADALTLLNASAKQTQDGRFMLGRDLVATWLNYLEGNAIGDGSAGTAKYDINQAINWFDATQAKPGTTDFDSIDFTTLSVKDDLTSGTAIKTNAPLWTSPIDVVVLGQPIHTDLAASTLHSQLDHYNNFGTV